MLRISGQTQSHIAELRQALDRAEAVLVGAGAGLSASAGFSYGGERFRLYFSDFEAKYGFHDMYSGGFYPFATLEEKWAYWSRFIFLNRYSDPPKPVYQDLRELIEDKDYFVLTTNVDHCFQKAGFDKQRLFYTQGDYGLWQCSVPCHSKTYDNEEIVRKMVRAQGFSVSQNGLEPPSDGVPKMTVPSELAPRCPKCGAPMTMNLRADATFAEDEGWHEAAARYGRFVGRHGAGRVLYLELGVGMNTPVIIKYPFWRMAMHNSESSYACINLSDAYAPPQILGRSVCIDSDIGGVISALKH